MSDKQKQWVLRVLFTAAALGWMIVIFSLSAQNAAASGKTSGGFSKLLFRLIYPGFSGFSAAKQQNILALWAKLIRKAAHFFLYFVLGGLVFGSVRTYGKIRLVRQAVITVGICAFYAGTDEFHQLFVPGRSGELGDVLLDTTASVLSVVLLSLMIGRKLKKQ